jgi:RNA polymerase sigma-70 factor, ECF subfamily
VRQLFDRCVTGDGLAWRDLHRTYYPTARRFLTHLGVASADLDDACQEVFVQVFRYLARFEQRADFRTWLYKLCLSQASRLRRRRKLEQALGWLLGRSPTTTGHDESEAMAVQKVQMALGRMKPLHRQVLVLFELEGVAGDEIARILGCPAATVRRRLHYARQEFEQLLCAGAPDADTGRSP